MNKAKLIFDASGLNALADDEERKALIEGLCIAYFVGVTVTAFSEIVGTPEEGHRRKLLDLLKRLLACGECVKPFNWIIEEHAKAYLANGNSFDWHVYPYDFDRQKTKLRVRNTCTILASRQSEKTVKQRRISKRYSPKPAPLSKRYLKGANNGRPWKKS